MLEPHNLYEVVGSRFGTSFETVDLAPYPVPRTYSLWDKGDQSNFYMNGPNRTLAAISNAAAQPVIAAIRAERSILLVETSVCGLCCYSAWYARGMIWHHYRRQFVASTVSSYQDTFVYRDYRLRLGGALKSGACAAGVTRISNS